MSSWGTLAAVFAAIASGGLYVRLRWYRSPRAYRAMYALAGCYFIAGALTAAWVMHLTTPKRVESVTPSAATVPSIPAPVASAVAAVAIRQPTHSTTSRRRL